VTDIHNGCENRSYYKTYLCIQNITVCFLILFDFEPEKPFSFDQRMEGFDAVVIPGKSFRGIAVGFSTGGSKELLEHIYLCRALRIFGS
jgi:hypothetical protein